MAEIPYGVIAAKFAYLIVANEYPDETEEQKECRAAALLASAIDFELAHA